MLDCFFPEVFVSSQQRCEWPVFRKGLLNGRNHLDGDLNVCDYMHLDGVNETLMWRTVSSVYVIILLGVIGVSRDSRWVSRTHRHICVFLLLLLLCLFFENFI